MLTVSCTLDSKDVEVYINDGSKFTLHQVINGTVGGVEIALSSDGRFFALEKGGRDMLIFQQG